jgi:hypothetical protein
MQAIRADLLASRPVEARRRLGAGFLITGLVVARLAMGSNLRSVDNS